MPAPRLQKLDLQGFRSFGTGRQTFNLSPTVTVVWGGNSQGKTSLAEGLEFLFTGQVARRELLASAKDEFAESLRNVHIPAAATVFVEAHIVCPDGATRRLRRTLVDDFKGSSACTSRLELDGAPCTEEDLATQVGLKLMAPPLRAPVLAQHTLAYIFSVAPGDRATYFRAVLDTQDLQDFRNAVAALETALPPPVFPELAKLAAIEAIPELAAIAKKVRAAKTSAELDKHLSDALEVLLVAADIPAKPSRAERSEQLNAALEQRRSQTFPTGLFARRPFTGWSGLDTSLADTLKVFERERQHVEAETRRLITLFKAALAIEAVDGAHAPIDCPLCATAAALTPARISQFREQVAANKAYQEAEKATAEALRELDGTLLTLAQATIQALPRFARETAIARREQAFTMARLRRLVPDTSLVAAWSAAYRRLRRAAGSLQASVGAARGQITAALGDLTHWQDTAALLAILDTVPAEVAAWEVAQLAYAESVRQLSETLQAAVDQSANTAGWLDLVNVARDPTPLWQAMERQRGHAATIKALQGALKEIDTAIGKVTDEKFGTLSEDVRSWWERLRPDEPSFFDAVKRRSAKARRNIDLKVGLSAHSDRSDAQLRDAVAVFSQSQLHCLGLALFLARTVAEGMGFVVLDDPVLTSDDDFRPNFEFSVLEALLDAGVQVIVLTQDYASWKNIGHRWDYRGVSQFQLVRDDPVIGTEVRSQKDQLSSILAKAQPFIKSHDAEQRKQGAIELRQAIERFCKEMLVRERHANGDMQAAIADYDGKNFGDFKTKVLALLTNDPSHSGKLTTAHNNVTPGPHDDRPPSSAQLKVAAGDIKALKKAYLD
jgi:hypothetical protein